MWRMRNTTTASEKQLLWLIGSLTADETNFFEILVPFPFFPRFQIYARSGDLIRISKDNQEKKLSFLCHMASKQQLLRLVGWITADGTNFFEILVQFPFFQRFQIYSRLGDLIRISKDNQERKKCHSCVDLTENFTEIFFCQIDVEKSYATLNPITKLCA